MKQRFDIQVQRADNGFIAAARTDIPGIPTKKAVAHTQEEVIAAVKDFADHMFDEPPAKAKPVLPIPNQPEGAK